MSTPEPLKASGSSPVENIINFCPLCGMQFASVMPTNTEINCDLETDGCGKTFKVRTKA